jgi:hypothetical protein
MAETGKENCKSLFASLNIIPDWESVNNDDTQKCFSWSWSTNEAA